MYINLHKLIIEQPNENTNSIGSQTISLTYNVENEMIGISNICITPIVGLEVITGATRMKAGTEQKFVKPKVPASILQLHPSITIILDQEAAKLI